MPEGVGYARRVEFSVKNNKPGEYNGLFSRSWVYRDPQAATQASLDFTFPKWHDLEVCYRGQGWERVNRKTHTVEEMEKDKDKNRVPCDQVEIEMVKQPGAYGYLLFSLLDRSGRPLREPTGVFDFGAGRVNEAWRIYQSIREGNRTALLGDNFQVQVFVQNFSRITPEQKQQAKRLFERLLEQTSNALTQESGENK